jgi:CRP-like cAMP-binding protein
MNNFSDTLSKILASGIEINYLPGEFLFRKGQQAEFVFYLLSGSITLNDIDNRILILGEKPLFLGLQEALEMSKYIFSVQTLEPSKFLVFDKKFFSMLLHEFDQDHEFVNQQIKEFELFHQLLP